MRSRSLESILPRHIGAQERRSIEEFSDRVRDLLGERLRDLRLFGSQVTGETHDESDIDLLVLVDDCTFQDSSTVVRLAAGISSWLSPKVIDFERYHAPRSRATGFYQEIRAHSVRLLR